MGLGAEISRTLASKGFSIIIHYRCHENEAQACAEECRRLGVDAECIQGDFSNSASIQKFLGEYRRRFQTIAHLVNNASAYLVKSGMASSMQEWKEMYQTNFFAPLELIQGLLPELKKSQGTILNIGVAGIGTFRADIYSTAYTLSKQSLLMLTKCLAKELAPYGVRTNLISPGYLENSTDLPANISDLPMKRLGTLKETALAAAFLLDKGSEYMTGQNIEIAGGVRL